jgi:hypothetical protein
MKLRDPEAWKKAVEANTLPPDDPGAAYAACTIRFVEQWADEMERRMEYSGQSVAEVAKAAADEVDRRPGMGITGFMYGWSVGCLAQVWEHGEALRRWHNLAAQIGNEGERANETGGVLNPAILSIGPKP